MNFLNFRPPAVYSPLKRKKKHRFDGDDGARVAAESSPPKNAKFEELRRKPRCSLAFCPRAISLHRSSNFTYLSETIFKRMLKTMLTC